MLATGFAAENPRTRRQRPAAGHRLPQLKISTGTPVKHLYTGDARYARHCVILAQNTMPLMSGMAWEHRVSEKEHDLAQQETAPRRDPSPWPTVVFTTFRLWLKRRKRLRMITERRQGLIAVTVWVVVGAATAIVTFSVVTHGPSAGHATGTAGRAAGSAQGGTAGTGRGEASASAQGGSASGRSGPTATASALIRTQAAGWIARQLSPSAIVACDPQMCSALQAAGLQASRLLVLRLSAADPLGAEVVVATLPVRSQFGTRLASVYAPEVIARFGSGPAGIEVRYVAPEGARSFEASRTADRGARAAAGLQLLHNQRIHTSTAARTALTAGRVDPRLLTTLAALAAQPTAAQQGVSVVTFGDPSPGAADAPLRGAEIGSGPLASMRAMRSFLLAQRSPYLPAQASLVPAPGGQYLLSVQFDAPSPLALNGGP